MYNSVIHHLYVYCVFLTQVKTLSITIYPPLSFSTCPHSPFPLVVTILLSASMRFFFLQFLSLFHTAHSNFLLTDSYHSVLCICGSVYILCICLFCSLDPHVSEIIWYLSFSDWLTSLSIMLSRSIYSVANGKIYFFFTAE